MATVDTSSTSPSAATHRVLLLGGHGKVALHLTPLLLDKSWHVTSVVRNPEHREEILEKFGGRTEKGEALLKVGVDSLEEVANDDGAARAKSVLDRVRPDYVVWSAGAGGKGGPSRTFAVDRDACKHYIRASVAEPSIQKFLLVSYNGSRRNKPSWWSDQEWSAKQEVNAGVLKNYHKAKVDSDEFLTSLAHHRNRNVGQVGAGGGDSTFQAIILRPGTLTDDPGTGKVSLGKIRGRGSVPRADVAAVAAALLDRDDSQGWIDLLDGDVPMLQAVAEVCRNKIDSMDDEDKERILAII